MKKFALVAKDDEISISERRKLEQFPDISTKTVFDGTFFKKFDSYVNDQFIKRDDFRKCYDDFDLDKICNYDDNKINELLQNKNVLVVAHGNSLRSIIKYLENISDEDIMNIELPTGVPYIYEMNEKLEIINRFFLK